MNVVATQVITSSNTVSPFYKTVGAFAFILADGAKLQAPPGLTDGPFSDKLQLGQPVS